jgi:hypothetical protein
MEKEVRVGIDQPGKQRHPGKLDDAGDWIPHIAWGPNSGDPVTAHEHDPSFSELRRDAVEDASGAQQDGGRRARSVSRTLRVEGKNLKWEKEKDCES